MKIIQNAAKINGEYFNSVHVHDFTGPQDGPWLDGGLEYLRRVGDMTQIEEMSLTSESTEEEIRNKLLWGTLGPKGDYEKHKFVLIKDRPVDHLEAILKNCPHIGHIHKRVVEYWLKEKSNG
ncbi:MAG: hypothetical protein ACREBU_04365 [Nitrososphaera sp.]